jgi:O-antigen/teichoic acid export membrane protein
MKNMAVGSITTTLTKVSFPLLANIQNDKERLSEIYRKILQTVIFITAPVLIAMVVLAEPIFIFLFTAKWVDAVPYFQIICIGAILKPINSYNINLFAIIGRSDIILKLELIEKPILIVLVAIALPFGIIPLLSTTIVYAIICFFINVSYSNKVLSYSYLQQMADVGVVILVSCAAATAAWLFNQILIANAISHFLQILIGFITFGLVYLSLAYIFKMKGIANIVDIIKK